MPATPSADAPVVRIETSMGAIRVRLDRAHAPRTVENFLRYVGESFYDGTIFHRVIDDFMIQGGGYTSGMARKQTHEPIALEISPALRHVDGAIAMARTNDPNSATAQFYICDGPQSGLDDSYAPFGVVIEGMDVARAIASTPTGPGDVPRTEVTIRSIRSE
ncbi:MAG: peptidylprolyl isomerase [Deltaproteobacteria bacterium]|nr:peptidylprolyl isomerase [Deltaproteobacteria bacterium]